MRAYIRSEFDYVGKRFPEEARRIYYGETAGRPVYGEATGAEVRELLEEGVNIAPLPGAEPDRAGVPLPAGGPGKGRTDTAGTKRKKDS